MRVAIQGEAGSNSHAAVLEMLGEQQVVACALSAEVFDRLAKGEADAAVLPIENSLHGSVAEHYDLLLSHDVVIVAELTLRIRHALIAVPGVRMDEVRRVLSHPVALSQCRRFFAEHPEIEAVPFYDTAGSVKYIVAENLQDAAAIARPNAAEVFGGEVLARDLEDDPQNFTRFFLLVPSAAAERLRPAGEVNKMSVAFAIEHRPGSLVTALQGLADLKVDLTRIESRPVPGQPWEYVFYVDLRFEGDETPDRVVKWLNGHCRMVKELGRYASA
ncbi:prephenate dehydratase [Terriglobus saanensis]|uniref:Prephenate dehydratase n=1 Tax=Terriglobus saanensis (strain ATCC BAA-1853 / DSM 23119 / SP1PR4) TaxID=401053 RepID=E8UYB1_TERSS|nr:prephenate dehydratase domain-containing protein [Terriglobus saanensis]ADV81999.1 Prephenate dehydratase [Terriglobus saanensis SP1PR4]